ncbi:MAG: ATP-binding protein [Actinobacteria bacterium]|nr:ATP-binding protein [Actinomycetota bacterium]
MDPLRNPYTPNAGAQPPVILGRDAQLQTFALMLARMAAGRTEQSMIITGLRGVGKTVLLGGFRKEALSQNWIVIENEVSKHSNEAFRREVVADFRSALFELSPKARWSERLKRAASVLKSFSIQVDPSGSLTAGVDVEAVEGQADSGNLNRDLSDLFVAVGEAAKDEGRGVVLLYDEIQFLNQDQLEAVISALHKTVQRSLPVTMVGAGLPQIAELAGDAKSYAERLFKFPRIGVLDPDDARRALAGPAESEDASFTSEALDRAVELTEGYPYFVQELGYAIWGVAVGPAVTAEDVETAIPLYESKLDSSFFRVRLDRATELQRAYLRAMAELGPLPQKAADVAALLQRTSPQVAPTRAELIAMGLLYTPEHGYAAFTVPHFDKFMKRAVPILEIPAVRRR